MSATYLKYSKEQNAELKFAFQEGYKAYQNDQKVTENPYSPMGVGTYEQDLYDEWIDGWYQAGSDE